MKYIDVHSHIHDKAFDEDRSVVVRDMEESGFATITVGTDLIESKKAVAAAEMYPHVWATVGMHPVDNRDEVFDREAYRELLMHPKVVALGECGLDYFHIKEFEGNKDAEVDRQHRLFIEQIELAVPLDMMHAETDSPYATPVPHRRKRNTPLYVEHIYEKIAEIKGLEKEEVRVQLIENARRIFGLTI